jgi:16S rRNA (cytosine1402-N4)-methyltransferase
LNITDGVYVDCTLGGGGHTTEILRRGGRVIGLDQDPDAIRESSHKLTSFLSDGKLEIIESNFRNIKYALSCSKLCSGSGGLVDAILLDLGVSSYQINTAERGFSFGADGSLTMQMCQSSSSSSNSSVHTHFLSASEVVNSLDSTRLANLLYELGDKPRLRVLAREIVQHRPLNTTKEYISSNDSKTSE